MKCFVVGCNNSTYSSKGLFLYHRIPQEKEIAKKWLDAIGRSECDPTGRRVCSNHFRIDDYGKNIGKRRNLHPYAIPSIDLPQTTMTRMSSNAKEAMRNVLLMKTTSGQQFLEMFPALQTEMPTLSEATIASPSMDINQTLNIHEDIPDSSELLASKKRPYEHLLGKSPPKTRSSATSSVIRKRVKIFHSYSKSPLHYKKGNRPIEQKIESFEN